MALHGNTIAILVGLLLLGAVGRYVDVVARPRRREARLERQRGYRRYLKTPEWQQRRAAIVERSRGFCEDCGSRESLDVHHLTYKRRGSERAGDLVALCRQCHKERHSGKRTTFDVIALLILRRWRIWRYSRATTAP
jgi:5-methylcytosine-specific restriction endonuclease McrA